MFLTLLEPEIMTPDYRQKYNAQRPHPSLGYLTPNKFALQWRKATRRHKEPGSLT